MCVKKCPSNYFSYIALNGKVSQILKKDFKQSIQEDIYCVEEFDKLSITNYDDLNVAVDAEKCAAYTIATDPGKK